MIKLARKIKFRKKLIFLVLLVLLGSIFGHLPKSQVNDFTPKNQIEKIVFKTAFAENAQAQSVPGQSEEDAAAAAKTPKVDSKAEETGVMEGYISRFVAWCVVIVTKFEGGVLMILTRVLFWLMSYNDFVSSPAVNQGWGLVRDIGNLFFVLILLVIAIATILRLESYNLKRLLPKVLIMAVLVNFSRVVCGLLIDFSQVVMMTFAASFVAQTDGSFAGESRLVALLQVQNMMTNVQSSMQRVTSEVTGGTAITFLMVVASGLLAVFLLLTAIVVVLVMLVVIAMRIVMLWLLVVLSPLAFVLAAFPQGQRYSQQWWQEFTKYVIVGPLLAFFLWLSFSLLDQNGNMASIETGFTGAETLNLAQTADPNFTGSESDPASQHFFTAIGNSGNFLNFVIAIGMLMGGLVLTQQMGVAGGQFAGQGANFLRKVGAGTPLKLLGWADRKVYSGELPLIGRFTRGLSLNPVRWYNQWSGYMERRKSEQEKMGVTGAGFKYAESMGRERRGILGELKGVAARPLQVFRLAVGSPADFMKYYGGIRGIPQMVRTVTGRERLLPGWVPRGPLASRLEKERRTKEADIRAKLAAGREADESEQVWLKRKSDLEHDLKTTRQVIVPSPYYAVEEFRSLVKDELNKLPDSMEWTDIQGQMDLAYRNKDASRFLALMQKATNDYNDNEWLNRYGYQSSVYGGRFWEDEQETAKAGKKGMKDFSDEILVGRFGLSQQQARSFMNDQAYINEDRRHGATARALQAKNGVFEWNDRITQASSIMNEFFKGNIRSMLQNSARLMYGGEDPNDPGQKYRIGLGGLMLMGAASSDLVHFIARKEFNKSTLAKFQEDEDTLKIAEKLEHFVDAETKDRLMAPGLTDIIRGRATADTGLSGYYVPTVKGEYEDLNRWAKIIVPLARDLAAGMSEEDAAEKYKKDIEYRAISGEEVPHSNLFAKEKAKKVALMSEKPGKEQGRGQGKEQAPASESSQRVRQAMEIYTNPDEAIAFINRSQAQDLLRQAEPAEVATVGREILGERISSVAQKVQKGEKVDSSDIGELRVTNDILGEIRQSIDRLPEELKDAKDLSELNKLMGQFSDQARRVEGGESLNPQDELGVLKNIQHILGKMLKQEDEEDNSGRGNQSQEGRSRKGGR